MRRKVDWVNAGIGIFITMLISFSCWAGNRVVSGLDLDIGALREEIAVMHKNTDDVKNLVALQALENAKVLSQIERRLRRIEEASGTDQGPLTYKIEVRKIMNVALHYRKS